MIVFGDILLPEQVDLIKFSKESNISYLLLFLFFTILLDLVVDSRLFESGSFPLQTWPKFLTTHSLTGFIHPPPDRENINVLNGSRRIKGDTKYFH